MFCAQVRLKGKKPKFSSCCYLFWNVSAPFSWKTACHVHSCCSSYTQLHCAFNASFRVYWTNFDRLSPVKDTRMSKTFRPGIEAWQEPHLETNHKLPPISFHSSLKIQPEWHFLLQFRKLAWSPQQLHTCRIDVLVRHDKSLSAFWAKRIQDDAFTNKLATQTFWQYANHRQMQDDASKQGKRKVIALPACTMTGRIWEVYFEWSKLSKAIKHSKAIK